ncbi:hypothetical protein AAFC00_002040 [Neodothiora populina]|uniref:Ser arg-related nuclear matrix protein n=1 Tax=Neodothiora populina TaxID=2781224 RepID=A0ABR3PG29_9PEZI
MAFRDHYNDRSRPRHYDYDNTNEHTRYDARPNREHDTYDAFHDSRYLYTKQTQQRHRSHSRQTSHPERRTWPPRAKVEEEDAALAKEFRPHKPVSEDAAQSRGEIDQDPIIMDVPEFIPDRRFVLMPSDPKATTTPPTSDDERRRRGRRKAPKLATTLPEMMREPSPYAWTKPASNKVDRSSGEFFLSPDTITPSLPTRFADIPRSAPTGASASVPPVNPAGDWSKTATVDRSQHPTTRDAMPDQNTSGFTRTERASSDEDTAQPRPFASRRISENTFSHPGKDARRSSSTEGHAPTSHVPRSQPTSAPRVLQHELPERLRRPASRNTTAAHSREASGSHSRHESYESSPRRTSSRYPPSPPRSPRLREERLKGSPVANISTSRSGSRTSSVQSSPQPSPHLSKSSMTADALWGSFAASTAAATAAGAFRPPKQSSRLSSSSLLDRAEPPRSVPTSYPAQASSPLPYPVDDRPFQSMPSEEDHQYVHPDQDTVAQPAYYEASRPSSSHGSVSSTSLPTNIRRPPLPSRNLALQDLSSSPASPRPFIFNPVGRPKTVSELKALARALPPCPRQAYSGRFDDWYTLDGCPGFDICPSCLDTVFGETLYRSYFRRSPSRALIGKGLQVKCDFADAWVRLAWLLTLQREIPSLDLVKAVINVCLPDGSDEACPGPQAAVRNWYSIRNRSGHFLRGFAICSADVKRLQVLFPGFQELWQPLPMRASWSYGDDLGGLKRTCCMRPALNNRFPLYIDTLVELHEPAYRACRMPDATDFVTLVRRKCLVPECTRDDMIRDGRWHYIPSLLPALTVCEDCFDEVVLPAFEADSDVAMRFNREAQEVCGEGRLGSSCQLYSSRMRGVFEKAVRLNDLKYLERRAMQRKEMEERLQKRAIEINKLKQELQRDVQVYGTDAKAEEDLDAMEADLRTIAGKWISWE